MLERDRFGGGSFVVWGGKMGDQKTYFVVTQDNFSYLKFTKYVTNIIAEPKNKYGQQEQVTVRNHDRSTALERSV